MRKLPIVRPRFPSLDKFAAEFSYCLLSGNVTNNGAYVQQFEAALTKYLGAPTLCFSSGMAALTTMLMAADVRGGEVLVPSFTFPATPHAVVLAGATPKFVDVNPTTLTIDPERVRSIVGARTRAILGVDVFGVCCDYGTLEKIAARHQIACLFDSAPAFGSMVDGQVTGDFGDCQIFSFHPTKPFHTLEGGCLCTRNADLFDRAAYIRNFGQDGEGGCPEIGLNGKMTEVCALIGLRQLEQWGDAITARRMAASRLRDKLRNVSGVQTVFSPDGQISVWTYQPVLIDTAKIGLSRDAVIDGLARNGVAARAYYPACHLLDCYGEDHLTLPVTNDVASRVISLPVYNDMLPEEISLIVDAFHAVALQCVS